MSFLRTFGLLRFFSCNHHYTMSGDEEEARRMASLLCQAQMTEKVSKGEVQGGGRFFCYSAVAVNP